MNHKNTTLAIAAIIVGGSIRYTTTGISIQTPQQSQQSQNSIKVDQQINQLNNCTTAICDNQANNNFGPPPVVVVWH